MNLAGESSNHLIHESSTLNGIPASAEEALRAADAAMYEAKRLGKDRVVVSAA